MTTYQRIPYKRDEIEGYRYLKNSRLTKERTVPHDVMEKFQYTDTIEYDEQPTLPRCMFCDAPKTRQRFYWKPQTSKPMTIVMCDWHYHNLNLGKIAQLVRELEAEAAEQVKAKTVKSKKPTKKGKKKWQAKAEENHSQEEAATAPSQALKELEV